MTLIEAIFTEKAANFKWIHDATERRFVVVGDVGVTLGHLLIRDVTLDAVPVECRAVLHHTATIRAFL